MLKTTLTDWRVEQFNMEFLKGLGLLAADYRMLARCTVLLLAVSLVQERGVVIRNWISERNVIVRYAVLLAGVAAVMILGVYGSGFDEASFIYYQF